MRRRDRWLLLLLTGLALFSVAAVVHEPLGVLDISRYIFSGGELARASGPLAISGTTGQPVAALSSAPPLTLYWGYWGSGAYYVYAPIVVRQR